MKNLALSLVVLAFIGFCFAQQDATFVEDTQTQQGTIPQVTFVNPGTVATGANTGMGTDDGDDDIQGPKNITEQVAAFETAYLKYMLDHHTIGIRAATACLESGRNLSATVLQICRYLNAIERAQYDFMADQLEFYYNQQHEASLEQLFNETSFSNEFWLSQLAKLQNATGDEEDNDDNNYDDDFQKKFLRFLVVYQGSGIIASAPCAQSAFHKDVLDFCISEILNGGSQIGQVRALLCAWYDECQVELTAEDLKAQLEAFNWTTLGLGNIDEDGEETGAETAINTSTELGTITITSVETEADGTFVA